MDSDDDLYVEDTNFDEGEYDDEEYNFAEKYDNNKNVHAGFHSQQQVLSEADIKQRQEDDIAMLSIVLSIPKVEATILLLYFNWDASKVNEEWFADEEGIRKSVGLLKKQVIFNTEEFQMTCGICFDIHAGDEITILSCGHPFCNYCWRYYIKTAITEGPGCLMLRCPEPSCHAAVTQDMIDRFTLEEDKKKYFRYLLRSYVESKKTTKWCPAPGCECAIDLADGCESFEVSCSCSHSFCWNCGEEPHRPVDCSAVAKWVMKNSQESENVKWLLVNSKACPKCKRSIEKNKGCMHMTCPAPCRHEFCWLCLGSWKEHGTQTGGYFACNRFEEAKRTGAYDKAEAIRRRAKSSLERYTHHYERWASNESSRRRAVSDLHKMEEAEILHVLSDLQCTPVSQLRFVTEAWRQIAEGRRVLKWTYAYGYYLAPEKENGKRELFEYLQGEAESGLERLHQCAEKELQKFFDGAAPGEFHDFRNKLVGLTKVTQVYFENLVQALEKGLSES